MKLAQLCTGIVLLSVSSLGVAGVNVDFDAAADFSKYKSYQWKEGTTLPNPLMQERLKAAVDQALSGKGMAASDKPDVFVITHGRLEVQKSVDLTTFGYGGYYGWSGGMTTSSATVHEIPVGTLIIDLVDASSNKLVWRGTGTDVVSTKPEKNAEKINKIVPKVFKNYPPKKKS